MLTIKIDNLDEFLSKFNQLNVELTFNKSIKKSVIYLEWEAIKETPVDKWFLWQSYETHFSNMEWKLINTRSYGVAVHEGHKQEVWRFVPAIWKRLTKSYVEWNPFLTRTAKNSNDKVNRIFNWDIERMLNTLKS